MHSLRNSKQQMTVDIDWNNLGFDIIKTKSFIQFTWKDGSGWDSGKLVSLAFLYSLKVLQNVAIFCTIFCTILHAARGYQRSAPWYLAEFL